MTLYHGTKAKFDRFDRAYLQSATKERTCEDADFMAVSKIGFCFTDDKYFTKDYCEDGYIITVEAELEEINYDSYNHFLEFLEEYGADEARELLIADGYDSVCLDNGDYNEYIILDESKIEIISIEKVN